MPLDLRHPTAPHQKLKLPEWYVSNLMMDRALDAICRRVKKFDRKHDVPYLAGYSLDGKTIYIDRHMPASFKFKGRTINTDRFLILHEEVEKTLIDQLGLHYLHAHQIATRAEQAAVRAAGVNGAATIGSCRSTSSASATSGSPSCQRISIRSRTATSTTTICCAACSSRLTRAGCPRAFAAASCVMPPAKSASTFAATKRSAPALEQAMK